MLYLNNLLDYYQTDIKYNIDEIKNHLNTHKEDKLNKTEFSKLYKSVLQIMVGIEPEIINFKSKQGKLDEFKSESQEKKMRRRLSLSTTQGEFNKKLEENINYNESESG